MPTLKPRITFTLDEKTLSRIDDYKYEKRCKNQTQAILELIEIGLNSIIESGNNPENSSLEYNPAVDELYGMIAQLDIEDRAEIRGEVKQMLKADKYRRNEESKNA